MRSAVGAVIVNYEDSASTVQTVKALLGQTYPHLEILIYDNASTPSALRRLRSLLVLHGFRATRRLSVNGGQAVTLFANRLRRIHVIEVDKNLGPGTAFAEGAAYWGTLGFPLVWFLDDDMRPVPDCLARMIECRARLQDRDKVIMIPLRVDSANGLTYPCFGFDSAKGVHHLPADALRDGTEVGMAPYAGMLGDPTQLAGAIPREYFIDSCDFALSRRLFARGSRIVMARHALALHDSGGKPKPTRILGVERHLRIPPGFRFYYLARNKWVFYQEASPGSPRAIVFYVRDLLELSVLAFCAPARRRLLLGNIMRGFLDGFRGHMGIRPDRALGQPPVAGLTLRPSAKAKLVVPARLPGLAGNAGSASLSLSP